MKKSAGFPQQLWKQPRIAKLDKACQVYDEEVIKQKYNWKTEVANKLVQTEDVQLEKVAMQQYEFRRSIDYQRYFRFISCRAKSQVSVHREAPEQAA